MDPMENQDEPEPFDFTLEFDRVDPVDRTDRFEKLLLADIVDISTQRDL